MASTVRHRWVDGDRGQEQERDMGTTPDATRLLARFVADLTYDDIPDEVVGLAKGMLLDYLGAALAGSQREHSQAALDMSRELGGNAQATILGTDERTSIDRAAFLNGMFGSSTPQLDDVCKESLGHPGVGTHPAVLAVGEHVRATGRDAIVAIVAGYELSWRVGAAVGLSAFDQGWHPRGGCNVFAAGVAAGKLLGLSSEEDFCAVLGLAGNKASGLISASFWHDAWYTLSGNASQDGVLAALLARTGYGAGCTVLEDPYGGYIRVVAPRPDWERLLEGLGQRFELPFTGLKPHSSSGATHAAVDAMLAIRAATDISVDEIERIEVRTYRVAAETLGKRHPDRHVHASMSIPYLVSVAFTDGQVLLPQFTPDKLSDPVLTDLQGKVEMILDPDLDVLAPKSLPAEVTVITRDGTRHTERVITPKGDPGNPLTPAEIDAKFRGLAAEALPTATIDEVQATVHRLEELDDMAVLAAQLRQIAH
jgi:2-methylcitrate dehydratase PrpD